MTTAWERHYNNKRSVANFNYIDKSLNKDAINEVTLLHKYYPEKLWLFKKAYKRFKKLNLLFNLSSSCLIIGGTQYLEG